MSRVYEDAKGDANDVKALQRLNKEFSLQVSLRRASQPHTFRTVSDIASTNFLFQTSFEHADPQVGIRDPCGPIRMNKGSNTGSI